MAEDLTCSCLSTWIQDGSTQHGCVSTGWCQVSSSCASYTGTSPGSTPANQKWVYCTQTASPPPALPRSPVATCTQTGTRGKCTGFLPSSAPGVVVSASATTGLTITAATMQGGYITDNLILSAFIVPTATGYIFAIQDFYVKMVEVSGACLGREAWPIFDPVISVHGWARYFRTLFVTFINSPPCPSPRSAQYGL